MMNCLFTKLGQTCVAYIIKNFLLRTRDWLISESATRVSFSPRTIVLLTPN